MKNILFVDDEPKVLQGLHRMLHSMRRDWNMEFAEGGHKALEVLGNSHFDVVVTDMRMPGMNGLEFLNEVKKRYPHIIRIVLSGQADKEVIIQSIGPIHQYLSKPCDPNKLKLILSQACSIHELLAEEKLKKIVSQMEYLPSLPAYYNELTNELQSESATLKSVGKIISKDIGMSAKILQMVNSAFFGIRTHVSSPERAVMLLGLEIVSALALSSHVFKQFDKVTIEGLSLDSLWNHCMTVGSFAKHICKKQITDQKTADFCFIAGLLHDVGKIVLAANVPDTYTSLLMNMKEKKSRIVDKEFEVFGVTHEKIGAYLMGLWGFNDSIIEALTFHHNPMNNISKEFIPLTAVYIANIIEHELFPERTMGVVPEIDKEYIKKLNLTDKIPIWRDECKKILEPGDNNE